MWDFIGIISMVLIVMIVTVVMIGLRDRPAAMPITQQQQISACQPYTVITAHDSDGETSIVYFCKE